MENKFKTIDILRLRDCGDFRDLTSSLLCGVTVYSLPEGAEFPVESAITRPVKTPATFLFQAIGFKNQTSPPLYGPSPTDSQGYNKIFTDVSATWKPIGRENGGLRELDKDKDL